ncbi:reverse transcriptase-like protein [Lederbergia lenta]|uniref:RNase H n=1 Tax=Lederbergia lenta TaxID=1467 RepID=A0A2X4Z7Q5_LEDLE|nr:reverse transcriptase-like protein [Lederbergia lenta]MCM3109331.1 reverse transcriptase-like protein [Lederbergia lenta]MEC2324903.1 reverse transcriptase-like protein [Lederbergia lenta]SQI56674.1 RNase H [Lederbergia lenta]
MVEVYIDGASAGDPGLSGAGIFIRNNGKVESFSIPLGVMDNHEAEFHALISSLDICLENGYSIISVRSDSSAVVNAIEKEYVRNVKYRPLLNTALELSNRFDLFFIKWIPSKGNKQADRLARKAIYER